MSIIMSRSMIKAQTPFVAGTIDMEEMQRKIFGQVRTMEKMTSKLNATMVDAYSGNAPSAIYDAFESASIATYKEIPDSSTAREKLNHR